MRLWPESDVDFWRLPIWITSAKRIRGLIYWLMCCLTFTRGRFLSRVFVFLLPDWYIPQHFGRKANNFHILGWIPLNTSTSLVCAFLLEETFIVLSKTANTMGRYARMIVVTILSPFLSRMLNVWATSLFTKVLALDTQMYLRELLGLEKLLDYWIIASFVLSFILFDRAWVLDRLFKALYINRFSI